MDDSKKSIKIYIIISVASVFFTLGLTFLYLKIYKISPVTEINIVPTPVAAESTPKPTVVVNLPNAKLPVLAYVEKENVFISNSETGDRKQITKNGSVQNAVWSKDGQWLYWFARYIDTDGQTKFSFAKGKYPEFNLEIFFVTDGTFFNDRNDIYSFIPLVKTNQLVIGSRDGLYLVENFTNKTGSINKVLAKYKPLEGMGNSDIKDSYGLNDIDSQEKNLLLSYCTWEMCPDIGYMNIKDSKFISLPKVYGDITGSMQFSPSGKYILISGGTNEMIGGDPTEVILSFPGLKTIFKATDLMGDSVGSASFIDDEIVALAVGFDAGINIVPPRSGISIINFLKQQQLSYIPIEFVKDNQNSFNYLRFLATNNNYIFVNRNLEILERYNLNVDFSVKNVIKYQLPTSLNYFSAQPL